MLDMEQSLPFIMPPVEPPSFSDRVFNVQDFGAVGDGTTSNTQAFRRAIEACHQEGVLIAPPFPYGISPYFTAYPGTLSLSTEAFGAVVREIIEGLLAQGFRVPRFRVLGFWHP